VGVDGLIGSELVVALLLAIRPPRIEPHYFTALDDFPRGRGSPSRTSGRSSPTSSATTKTIGNRPRVATLLSHARGQPHEARQVLRQGADGGLDRAQ
jgi:hypothetical protein